MAEKTALQKMTELKAAGWNGVGDINQVYARTATQADGGNAPNPVQSSAPAAAPQGSGTYAEQQAASLARDKFAADQQARAANEASVLAGFKESSGFSREQLAETTRQFNATLAQKEAEWTRDGVPRLVIAQRLAALEDEKFRETVRQFNESTRQFNATQGMDYLKFASTLGGPSNVFQQADFFRGAQQTGQMPTFLNALASNTALPSFQSAGGVAPTAQTAGGLAGQLGGAGGGGGTTPGGYNTDAALAQVGSIFKGGATGLAAGSLERLDPNELGIMQSGAKKLGLDWDQFVRTYQRSGVGQTAGSGF